MLPQHIAPPDANRNRLTNRNRNRAAPMGNYAAHRGRATKVALKPAASALTAVEVAPPQTTDSIIMVAKKAAPAVTSSARDRVRSQTAVGGDGEARVAIWNRTTQRRVSGTAAPQVRKIPSWPRSWANFSLF